MSNADKRTVATDALDTLGHCPIPADSGRDAIHLAVEPVVAAETLLPCQHVGLTDGKASGKAVKLLGIVDPFIKDHVVSGQRFWLVVYPREITSLRHVWTHPAFARADEDEPARMPTRSASETWLRDFIAKADCPSYETVMAKATAGDVENYGDGESYLFFQDMDAHGSIPPEFWDHVENVTGNAIPPENRATGFTCSC